MTRGTLAIFAALAVLATRTLAQDAASLRDDQLLGAVAEATEAQQADRLLSLMTEVRARGLLMFKADGPSCEPVIPETGLLATMIPRGTARWAYITQARITAMSKGACNCPFSLLSFDRFTRDLAGAVAPDLTRQDLAALQEFRAENEGPTETAWRDYRQNVCGR